ncbi:amidohydrolase family protein [Phocaeicola fibrisolvens]|uniref:amidohydrolase family protein n=1 Tax=Phocaeicola fibrisolvens TaxID=2981793 RepID=UPI0008205A95|nr:amidohydrolase family protein [Phocaeicola fibrisolvens]MCU6776775.1 amidohydrolase family protein [Phocaeicola fibrisolvens]SCG99269.1 Predicted metal-dependent hydrolase of the TIM-barrel fold [uncultured Bacteroides sp.]
MNKLILTGALCAAFATVSAQMVDVHSHIILPEYREVLKAHGAELEETFPLPEWNVERHIAFMDSAGIRTAVLTMPAPQPYYGDAGESAACIRRVNEVSAEIKQRYPERFKFCASLPLPDVEAAIREAVYALDTLGADGVKLATNSRGQYLGDEALDPLMEILNERHAVVILHPHRPTPYPKEIIATTPLAMYEYPAETTRAVVNMLARNVLVRYPNLKVVVPHCGSFLPLALPRMKSILPAMVKQGYMQPIDWEGNLLRLYFDLAGNPTMEILRSLLTLTTPDHILYGSDYPYLPDAVLKANLQRLKQTLASDKELAGYADLFLWKNADGLFVKCAAAGSIRKE